MGNMSLLTQGIAFTIIVLFVGMSIIPSTGSVSIEKSAHTNLDGKTLYVGGDGPGNYSNIQDAIDNASDGDTVFVYDDSSPYIENVVIDKSISLIGEDKNTTVIEGVGNSNAVFITTDGVNISRFTIKTSGGGIYIEGSNYASIVENIIKTLNYECITLRDSRGHNVINNLLKPKLTRAFLTVHIHSSIISGNTFEHQNGAALALLYSNDNIVLGNTIVSTCSLPDVPDIRLVGCQRNIISNNTLIGEGELFSRLGIKLAEFNRYNVLSGNTIDGYRNGITISSFNSRNNITGNVLSNNGLGIQIALSNFNTIYQNNFFNNGKNAYFCWFSIYNKWKGNYWGEPRILPYPIRGSIWLLFYSWYNFDWNPVQEPYNITIV